MGEVLGKEDSPPVFIDKGRLEIQLGAEKLHLGLGLAGGQDHLHAQPPAFLQGRDGLIVTVSLVV